jgi:peptidoglycan/LPS O-acetylase OafA/YrhL
LRRSLRIMPAYYVALLVITVLIPPSAGPLRPGHVQSAALYYSNYYQALHGSTHGALSPYWSLAVEEQFYLLWPLCFVFARRLRAHILVLVILAVWWQRAVVCWGEGDMEWAYHALDCRADHLLVGCLSALALHRGHLAPLWGALCRGSGPLWLSFGLLVALTLLPLVAGESLRVGFAFYLEPWIIAGLLIQVIAGCAEGRLAWLDGALLRWLGNRSYAIYLYHVFAMDIVGRVIDGTRLQLVVPTLLLTLVLAQASWVLIEAPIQRRRGRWLASSSALSPPPDAS